MLLSKGTACRVTETLKMPPNENTIALLDKVWDVYSEYTGVQLSAMTHRKGTPWDVVWRAQGGDNYRGATIPNELIMRHYKERIDAQPNA